MWIKGIVGKVLGVSLVWKVLAGAVVAGGLVVGAYTKGMDRAYANAAENHEEHIALIYEQMNEAVKNRDAQWRARVQDLNNKLLQAQHRAIQDAQLERTVAAQIKAINVNTQEIQRDAYSSELGTCQLDASYSRLLNNAYTEAASSERPSTSD